MLLSKLLNVRYTESRPTSNTTVNAIAFNLCPA
jgi:hypothetical protein